MASTPTIRLLLLTFAIVFLLLSLLVYGIAAVAALRRRRSHGLPARFPASPAHVGDIDIEKGSYSVDTADGVRTPAPGKLLAVWHRVLYNFKSSPSAVPERAALRVPSYPKKLLFRNSVNRARGGTSAQVRIRALSFCADSSLAAFVQDVYWPPLWSPMDAPREDATMVTFPSMFTMGIESATTAPPDVVVHCVCEEEHFTDVDTHARPSCCLTTSPRSMTPPTISTSVASCARPPGILARDRRMVANQDPRSATEAPAMVPALRSQLCASESGSDRALLLGTQLSRSTPGCLEAQASPVRLTTSLSTTSYLVDLLIDAIMADSETDLPSEREHCGAGVRPYAPCTDMSCGCSEVHGGDVLAEIYDVYFTRNDNDEQDDVPPR